MHQTEFKRLRRILPGSQASKILSVLMERRGEWVPMPDLWRASGAFAVHSRVADLRQAGHDVRQQSSVAPDGTCLSRYMIPL